MTTKKFLSYLWFLNHKWYNKLLKWSYAAGLSTALFLVFAHVGALIGLICILLFPAQVVAITFLKFLGIDFAMFFVVFLGYSFNEVHQGDM